MPPVLLELRVLQSQAWREMKGLGQEHLQGTLAWVVALVPDLQDTPVASLLPAAHKTHSCEYNHTPLHTATSGEFGTYSSKPRLTSPSTCKDTELD